MIQVRTDAASDKTRVADLSRVGGYFDFLDYRFAQTKGQSQRRFKPTMLTAVETAIKELTPRTNPLATQVIVVRLNRMLKGVYGYFQHVSCWVRGRYGAPNGVLSALDGRVRYWL